MRWFSNIKIRSKMFFGFSVVIILAIILALFSIVQLSNMSTRYNIIFEGAVTRRGAANAVQSNVRGYRRVVANAVMVAPLDESIRLPEIDNMIREAEEMRDTIWAELEIFDYSARTEPGQNETWRNERFAASDNVRRLFDEYRSILIRVLEYSRAGDHATAFYVATEEGREIVQELIAVTDGIVTASNDVMDTSIDEAGTAGEFAFILVLAITAVLVIIAIFIAMLVSRAVSRPITGLVKLVDAVADGRLNINMDTSKITTDEVGELTRDIYGLVNTIRGMVDDFVKMGHEFRVVGDIEYRVDVNKYHHSFQEMVNAVHGIVEDQLDSMNTMLSSVNSISDGDFKIAVADQPGKKMIIPNTLRAVLTNLQNVSGEVSAMIDAAANKGDLHFHVNPEKYKGDWREIVAGLNHIAESVDAPVVEIRDVIANLAKGDFSKNVTGDYKGDFLDIKQSVNTTISTLSGYILEIAKFLERIAGGDLTHSITREYMGSFSAIKDSLNTISKTLSKTMSEISSASAQVLSGAKQISTSSMDLANGASQQASSVEELNASVDLINQQTQANAQNATQANNLSDMSTKNANEGNEAMQQTLSAMNQIKDASNNISKIIRTIQDIAFQTNLLALNAAVEAARAGEHGRGFAVVAEEVRSLAARSQTAAQETTELINTSISTVEKGAEIASTTAKSLDTIVDNAGKVLHIVSDISTASNEQAEAVSQVVVGLNQISSVVQSNSAVSEETAAAAEELTSQAEILQQLVSYFKV